MGEGGEAGRRGKGRRKGMGGGRKRAFFFSLSLSPLLYSLALQSLLPAQMPPPPRCRSPCRAPLRVAGGGRTSAEPCSSPPEASPQPSILFPTGAGRVRSPPAGLEDFTVIPLPPDAVGSPATCVQSLGSRCGAGGGRGEVGTARWWRLLVALLVAATRETDR